MSPFTNYVRSYRHLSFAKWREAFMLMKLFYSFLPKLLVGLVSFPCTSAKCMYKWRQLLWHRKPQCSSSRAGDEYVRKFPWRVHLCRHPMWYRIPQCSFGDWPPHCIIMQTSWKVRLEGSVVVTYGLWLYCPVVFGVLVALGDVSQLIVFRMCCCITSWTLSSNECVDTYWCKGVVWQW